MTAPENSDRAERLRIHRELQLLRAAAWRPPTGQGWRKRAWVRTRIRKLDQAERYDQERNRPPGSDPDDRPARASDS